MYAEGAQLCKSRLAAAEVPHGTTLACILAVLFSESVVGGMRGYLVVGEASVEEGAEVARLLRQGLAVAQDGAMEVAPLAQHVAHGVVLLRAPSKGLLRATLHQHRGVTRVGLRSR